MPKNTALSPYGALYPTPVKCLAAMKKHSGVNPKCHMLNVSVAFFLGGGVLCNLHY